jgi:hypothetical protein
MSDNKNTTVKFRYDVQLLNEFHLQPIFIKDPQFDQNNNLSQQ